MKPPSSPTSLSRVLAAVALGLSVAAAAVVPWLVFDGNGQADMPLVVAPAPRSSDNGEVVSARPSVVRAAKPRPDASRGDRAARRPEKPRANVAVPPAPTVAVSAPTTAGTATPPAQRRLNRPKPARAKPTPSKPTPSVRPTAPPTVSTPAAESELIASPVAPPPPPAQTAVPAQEAGVATVTPVDPVTPKIAKPKRTAEPAKPAPAKPAAKPAAKPKKKAKPKPAAEPQWVEAPVAPQSYTPGSGPPELKPLAPVE
jgi:hypothetical protein